MEQVKYAVCELSARAVIGYGKQGDGKYIFDLDCAATAKCKNPGAAHEQSSNALFYQILCHMNGRKVEENPQNLYALYDAIFYMDFSGIFDVRGSSERQRRRKEKARDMFRPDGITLDFGSGPHRYVAFERSGSMSRQGKLSFIRGDFYEPVRRRIMLDMHIGKCQLSKLYAYNGLMLSSGVRIDDIGIDQPSRVIVIDNPIRTSYYNIFTVQGTVTSRVFYRIVAKAVRMGRYWPDAHLQGLTRPKRSPSASLSFAAFDLCR